MFTFYRCYPEGGDPLSSSEVQGETIESRDDVPPLPHPVQFPDPPSQQPNSPKQPPYLTTQIPPLDLNTETNLQVNLLENIPIPQEQISLFPPTHHVQFESIQTEERIQLLTPDHFLLNLDHLGPAPHSDFSPLSTPRTVDSTSLAVRSMIQTIDSTSGFPGAPHRETEMHSLPLSEQIIRIRNQLKSFEQQKKKLRWVCFFISRYGLVCIVQLFLETLDLSRFSIFHGHMADLFDWSMSQWYKWCTDWFFSSLILPYK